jgi:hypothetical protein
MLRSLARFLSLAYPQHDRPPNPQFAQKRAFGADAGKTTRTPAGADDTVCSPLPTNARFGLDDGLSGTRIRSRFLAWVTSTEHYWVNLAKRQSQLRSQAVFHR